MVFHEVLDVACVAQLAHHVRLWGVSVVGSVLGSRVEALGSTGLEV